MKSASLSLILLLLLTQKSFAHGNHGGGTQVSIEDDLTSGSHTHLPVRVESTGEILFGFESPFEEHNHGYESVDHGDDGHEDHEHEHDGHEHGDEDSQHEGHQESSFHIAPTVIIGGDKIDRLISRDVVSTVKIGIGAVTPAKKDKGYIHIQSTRLLLGAGIEIHKHLNVGAFGAGLGLIYAKNHTSYSEVLLNSLNEKGREIKLPGNYNEFSKWRVEEKVSYITNGAIVFNASVGIDPLIHAGVIASASGSWLLKFKKISSEHLSVSLSSVKAKSFGVEIDSAVLSMSLEKLKAAEKGLNFIINMNSPKAVEALKFIYRGDLRAIQDLSQDANLVVEMESSEGKSAGFGRSISINLPFLVGFGASKYTSESFQTSLNNQDGDEGVSYANIITKDESSKGVLSNHKKEMNQFAVTYLNKEHGDHKDQFYAANFKWHYEKDDVKASVVVNKLRQLTALVGFDSLRDLKISQEELGHFRISFDISMTESDIFTAIKLLSESNEIKGIRKKSLENIDTYIQNNNLDLCIGLENKEECSRNLKYKSIKMLDKLVSLAKASGNYIKAKKPAKAIESFSELGTLLMKNQFISKEILQNLLDTEVSLSIEGERVAKQKMLL